MNLAKIGAKREGRFVDWRKKAGPVEKARPMVGLMAGLSGLRTLGLQSVE